VKVGIKVPGVKAGMLAENSDGAVVVVDATVAVVAFSRPPSTESPPTDKPICYYLASCNIQYA